MPETCWAAEVTAPAWVEVVSAVTAIWSLASVPVGFPLGRCGVLYYGHAVETTTDRRRSGGGHTAAGHGLVAL